MSKFAQLKNDLNELDRYSKVLEKINGNDESYIDTRFWYPQLDANGNGSALIRFLPPPEVDGDEALPWARLWTHWFKGPTGKVYAENSLTTLGKTHKDPVSEYNTYLWNLEDNDSSPYRKQARAQKRKLVYISNIYVIDDPKNPENNGKVFLYKYGSKIHDKIMALWKPDFEGDKPVNVFNLWRGANFKLRIRKVESYTNYDQSFFESPSPLSADDALLEKVYNSEHSLSQFTAPDQFKSYDELLAKLNDVLGIDTQAERNTKKDVSSKKPARNELDEDAAFLSEMTERRQQKAPARKMDDDLDDDMDQFKSLADL